MGFTLTEIKEYMSSLDKDPKPLILYRCDVKNLLQGHNSNEIQNEKQVLIGISQAHKFC